MLHFGDSVYEADLRRGVGSKADARYLGCRAAADKVSDHGSVWAERIRYLMVRLGDLLVAVGCELQSRYAVKSSTTLS
jgi:hypothetical protein